MPTTGGDIRKYTVKVRIDCYNPRSSVTFNFLWMESWTYLSLESPERHLPWLLNIRLGTPLFAAVEAPPALKLYFANFALLHEDRYIGRMECYIRPF